MYDNEIFILFSCNEWCEYSSMRLLAASTTIEGLYPIIERELADGNMEYCGLQKFDALKHFIEDRNKRPKSYRDLMYGFVNEINNSAYSPIEACQVGGYQNEADK